MQALERCRLLFNVLPVCLCGTGKHHWALTFILGSGALRTATESDPVNIFVR